MEEIAFKNGFLCGLVSTGLGIGKCGKEDGSESTESSQLPKVDQMKVVNIEGFNPQGTYLKSDAYVVILSSTQDYIPKQGYVIIGGYMLMDMEGEVDFPQADIRVTVDDVLIFQGLDYEYFEDKIGRAHV